MKTENQHAIAHSDLLRAALALCVLGLACMGSAAALEVDFDARLHLDYADHDADRRPLSDRWTARRATVGLDGKFNDDWSFEVAYALSSNGEIRPRDGKFNDVALTYEGWRVGDVTAGQFKVPFGLEELTSSNDILFIERALPVDAFALSRRVGFGLSHQRAIYTATAMAFGSTLDGDDRGRGVAARLTIAPDYSTQSVLHLGVAVALESPRSKVDFDAAPESRVADVDLVNTGRISDVNRIHRFGLEGAWRSGPLSVQAEWMRASIRRSAGHQNAKVDGWYVAGNWVLTGESRPYKNGRFRAIKPQLPSGAWELTARYSHINLDGGNLRGGREHNATLGVNYTLNKHLRIMLNHIWVHSQRRGLTDAPNILLLRLQWSL